MRHEHSNCWNCEAGQVDGSWELQRKEWFALGDDFRTLALSEWPLLDGYSAY
jgi:hypothetical protein